MGRTISQLSIQAKTITRNNSHTDFADFVNRLNFRECTKQHKLLAAIERHEEAGDLTTISLHSYWNLGRDKGRPREASSGTLLPGIHVLTSQCWQGLR